jgi:RNA methyltransferase, TrmH family
MITSIHNPKIQSVRKLQAQAKVRREAQAFVIEGVRLAEEALQGAWQAQLVLFTDALDERGKVVLEGFSARGTSIEQVNQAVMQAVSETETPQGLLVVLAQQTLPIPKHLNFLLILDGVRDPGNLGTVLRTAEAAGVQAVLLAARCVDAWSPKVLRSGMGAHFRLPIHNLSWQDIRHSLKQEAGNLKVFLADSAGGSIYTQADFRPPLALILGGEAAGAGSEANSLTDEKVHIAMPGASESLNVAIAAGILLFEVVRQRQDKTAE